MITSCFLLDTKYRVAQCNVSLPGWYIVHFCHSRPDSYVNPSHHGHAKSAALVILFKPVAIHSAVPESRMAASLQPNGNQLRIPWG